MCASEGSPIIERFRCAAYERLNGICLAFAARHGIRDWSFNWREQTKCRKITILYLYLIAYGQFILLLK